MNKHARYILLRKIVCVVLLAIFLCANANARLLLMASQESPLYRSFQQGFESGLNKISLAQGTIYILAEDYRFGDKPDSGNIIIAAGVEAAKRLANLKPGDSKIIYTMLPQSSYQWLSDNNLLVNNHHVLFVDQPPYRFVNLAKIAFPSLNTLNYLYGGVSAVHMQDLKIAADQNQLQCDGVDLKSQRRLLSTLDSLVKESELVLVLPDPILFDRRTVQALLLASLHQQIPVLAYSESYVRAGALLALFSSPEQLGRQTAELVNCLLGGCQEFSEYRHYPKYFSVHLNNVVARQMGFAMPPVARIQFQLELLEPVVSK